MYADVYIFFAFYNKYRIENFLSDVLASTAQKP